MAAKKAQNNDTIEKDTLATAEVKKSASSKGASKASSEKVKDTGKKTAEKPNTEKKAVKDTPVKTKKEKPKSSNNQKEAAKKTTPKTTQKKASKKQDKVSEVTDVKETKTTKKEKTEKAEAQENKTKSKSKSVESAENKTEQKLKSDKKKAEDKKETEPKVEKKVTKKEPKPKAGKEIKADDKPKSKKQPQKSAKAKEDIANTEEENKQTSSTAKENSDPTKKASELKPAKKAKKVKEEPRPTEKVKKIKEEPKKSGPKKSESKAKKEEISPSNKKNDKPQKAKKPEQNAPSILKEENFSKYTENIGEKEDEFITAKSERKKLNQSKFDKIIPIDTDRPPELLRKVLAIMSAIIIIVCLIVLVVSTLEKQNGKGSPKGSNDPQAGFVFTTGENDKIIPEGMLEKYQKLYLKNKDTVGVISFDKTEIEQPVLKSEDNKYYLTHDFNKKESQEGSIFMDTRCESDLNSFNTVLYANNNEDESFIFSPLLKYTEIDEYKQAPVFTYNTLFAEYRYKIYACYIVTTNAQDDNGYAFDYASQEITADNLEGFLEQVDMRKLYTTGVDMTSTDKLLTIAIPIFGVYKTEDSSPETKLIILARQLREGESEEIDASKISRNKNIYKPQVYYDNIGKENTSKDVPRWNP